MSRRPRTLLRVLLAIGVALSGLGVAAPTALANTLDGVYHAPYGNDDLYGAEPTERTPRDVMAGDAVQIKVTTWPISPGQSVWVTWTKNGVAQTPVGGSWTSNSGNNSYWVVPLGSFARGDQISYTVNADVDHANAKAIGPFTFAVTSWSGTGSVTAYTNNGTTLDVTTGDTAGSFTSKIRFAFPAADRVRVQVAPKGSGLDIPGGVAYTVTNTTSTLTLATSALQLKIQKSPYRLSLYKADGTTLIAQEYDPATNPNVQWASDGAGTVTKIRDEWSAPTGQRFEGYGERYDTLDQRGQDVANYVYNQYRDQGPNHRTYLSAPFYTSSAGYGVYVNSTRFSTFDVGTIRTDMAGFTADTGGAGTSTLDYYLFTGTPANILDAYTATTARPQLPPKWAFGLWMSANEWNTQAEVNAELANVTANSIPTSAMVLEQWSDEATFYLWHGATYTPVAGGAALHYSDLAFPAGGEWADPKAMVTSAHNQGIKVVLWQIPVLKQNFDANPSTAPQQHINDRDYAIAQGYVVGNGSGGAYRIPTGQWFGDSTVPDFTKPAATTWWMSKRAYLFDDVGIDGLKTDGSEAIFGRDLTFGDGRVGAQMHNAYPNSYTQAYNTFVASKTGGNGVVFARAGTSGAQANGIFWAGDQSSTFSSFQQALRAGISAGQSGVPFWTWDMAGFTGDFPSSELYLRSAAASTFMPIMQYHSEKSNPSPSEARTPWNVQARSGDSTVVPTFRKFANTRMNLIPYLYTEAKNSSTTGAPMMQAMDWAYPSDPATAGLDQQYLLGRQLLVAPIATQGASTKDVYLPSGDWFDFWTGTSVTGGGTQHVAAGLDTIPVYARGGAIIPLNLNADYQLGGTIGNSMTSYPNLVFRIYPAGTSSYGYFDDSTGVTRTFTSSEAWNSHTETVSVPVMPTTSTLQVSSTRPTSVTRDGTALTEYSSVAMLKSASEGWYWDASSQLTYVKLPASASAHTVVIGGVNKAVATVPSQQRVKYTAGGNYIVAEFLDDDLVHFETGAGAGPNASTPLETSPQVLKKDYPGPSTFTQSGSTYSTAGLKVSIDTSTLCATVYDLTKTPQLLLHTECPRNLSQAWKGLSFTKSSMQNAYGLGEQFYTTASADGDLVGRQRTAGGNYGNAMVYDTVNGPVGNTQIPVLFAVGDNTSNFGLFVDGVYKQQWDVTADPWTMDTYGDQVRWYVMTGPDLPDLRKDYLELTGKPPVPPKKAFGLWNSEFGYDNWTELDTTLANLRTDKFPVDGFMLDVNWFGGVTAGSDNTHMGTLAWDATNFPNAPTKIADLRDNQGVGVMTIEESYVGKGLAEHTALANQGYLIRSGCSTCAPVYLTSNDWWGRGGMIDWTQPAAGAYWAANKRQALINSGVMGHWLDLGEPEMYDAGDWAAGTVAGKNSHADYHNLYNLLWADSVAKGYLDNGDTQRPFVLSRSGAAGIQRDGTAMWSGDIGSKLSAVADQANVQMHMSMSGIDYFGSDIGGFRREMLNSDLNELYTQWFANSAWFDVPVRPHTENLCNCAQTAPDKIGDVPSNLANIRQRYELTPYYYSLAHKAYQSGDPLVPPLVYYYQNDPNVREMGSEKLIGRDLLVGVVAGSGERQRNMYLPAGTWFDYRTNQRYVSTGQWINNVPEWVNGKFQLPAYARSGAIIPKMFVDDKTMNAFGKRTDASVRNELMARVYADPIASSFSLAEDDGTTVSYQGGAVRTTLISQQLSGNSATVTIAASSGTYANAPTTRSNVVELVTSGTQASAVTLNGTALTQFANKAAFDAAASGWYNAGGNLVVAKSTSLAVTSAKSFQFTLGQAAVSVSLTCTNGTTTSGQSVYAVGNIPQLGSWSPASAVKLDATNYPTWTATVANLPPGTAVEWKCIKRQEANYPATADAWQPGVNSTFTTPASGSAGSSSGGF